jgi:hypothetical protein
MGSQGSPRVGQRKRAASIGVLVVLLAACSAVAPSTSVPGTVETNSSATLVPTTAAPASPAASIPSRAPAPADTWGDWLADAGSATPGLSGLAPRIQLSIAWQDGRTLWLQTSASDFIKSKVLAGPPNEIGLEAADSIQGCTTGQVGRYGWQRSSDGLFLTLTLIKDPCALRAAILTRTWVHSLGAVNDGRAGVARFEPMASVQAKLPALRFAMGGADGAAEIHTFGGGPPLALLVIPNPGGFTSPCSSTPTPIAIGSTAAAFGDYLRSLPSIEVAATHTKVDGRDAMHFVLTSKATTCPRGDIAVVGPATPAVDAIWGFTPGTAHSLWLVQVDDAAYLLWYEGEGVTEQDELTVISSIHFSTTLPVLGAG